MSRKHAEDLVIEPLIKNKAMSWAGVNPGVMGSGPVPASQMVLKRAGLKVSDIDLWEINEAFAIVPLYVMKMLKIDKNKVKVNGGAIALGHPLGMTGVRLVGTLKSIMQH